MLMERRGRQICSSCSIHTKYSFQVCGVIYATKEWAENVWLKYTTTTGTVCEVLHKNEMQWEMSQALWDAHLIVGE